MFCIIPTTQVQALDAQEIFLKAVSFVVDVSQGITRPILTVATMPNRCLNWAWFKKKLKLEFTS